MLIHHFKMRSDIDSYNLGGCLAGRVLAARTDRRCFCHHQRRGLLKAQALLGWLVVAKPGSQFSACHRYSCPRCPPAGGMGCSAGVIAVDLAAKVLRVRSD